MSELKRTPLFPLYESLGAKTVDFGGFEMPVQFSGIIAEHEAVRTRAGLFDVSHMGEFEVAGREAMAFLQHVVTNDVSKLVPGKALYTPMVYPHGGTVDDLLIYCFTEERFWAVVNAGNIVKDWAWMTQQAENFDVKVTDRSDEIALLAVQGPSAVELLTPLVRDAINELSPFRFLETKFGDVPVVASRTGYTGEDGFELYLSSADSARVFTQLLEAGQPFGLVPCGLGSRDTLRLEARLPLYGHELTEHISPLEAGLGMFVKLKKGPFTGSDALQSVKAQGLDRKIVGLRVTGRGIPRQGYDVFKDGTVIGTITSGTMSPTLKAPIGLALVQRDGLDIGTELTVDIRGKQVEAVVVETPFYRRP